MRSTTLGIFVLMICALFVAETRVAPAEKMGSLRGTVRDREGRAVNGALIKIHNLSKGITVAVFSERGSYRITNLYPGPSQISASLAGYTSSWDAKSDILPDKESVLDIVLDNASKPILTPSDWMPLLPDDGDGAKELFVRNCVNCHGPGQAFRYRFDSLGWKKVIVAMRGAIPGGSSWHPNIRAVSDEQAMAVRDEDSLKIVDYLTKHFGPEARPGRPDVKPLTYRTANTNSKVMFTQFDIPTPKSWPHNVKASPDGKIWFTEYSANKIGLLDPKTGQFREFPVPDGITRPLSLVFDKQGIVWWAAGANVAKLDPDTGQMKVFPFPAGYSGAHTIAYGRDGIIYMTNNQGGLRGAIISFKPQTETFKQYPISTKDSRPYGIVVDSHNHIWFCESGDQKIGMLDPSTGAIKEYETPTAHSAPRRPAVDREDNIWFAEYNTSKLGRVDHKTGKVTEWAIPTENSAPYELAIDPRGIIWISEFAANKLGRFDPATSQFTEYALPGGDSQIRKMTVDPEGAVWLAEYNNSRITRVVEKR